MQSKYIDTIKSLEYENQKLKTELQSQIDKNKIIY